MKVYFSGVGDATHIDLVLEHPAVPNLDDAVMFEMDDDEEEWNVRHIAHTPMHPDYDVYCVVGPLRGGIFR